MGEFASTPVAATKWDSTDLVRGLKVDIKNILKNIETIYKDIYAFPSWDNDGSPNSHLGRRARTAITKGDACYFPSATGLARAQANSLTTSRVVVLANSDLGSGVTSKNYHRRGPWGSTRYNFTSIGNFVWLSGSTAGLLVVSAPTSSSVAHSLGIAETSTQINFQPFAIYQTL